MRVPDAFHPRRLTSRGPALLLGLMVALAGAWGTLSLARVGSAGIQDLDERVVRGLRRADDPAVPIGPAWLPEVGRDITALGGVGVLLLVTVTAAGYLILARKHGAAIFVLTSVGLGWGLSNALKALVGRERPGVVPHLMPAYHSSFPSGHSMMSAVVYLTLGALLARLLPTGRLKAYVLVVALLLTGLVGISRIYLGVHFPTDVAAGWCFGLAWATLCWYVERRLQRRGVIEAGEP